MTGHDAYSKYIKGPGKAVLYRLWADEKGLPKRNWIYDPGSSHEDSYDDKWWNKDFFGAFSLGCKVWHGVTFYDRWWPRVKSSLWIMTQPCHKSVCCVLILIWKSKNWFNGRSYIHSVIVKRKLRMVTKLQLILCTVKDPYVDTFNKCSELLENFTA